MAELKTHLLTEDEIYQAQNGIPCPELRSDLSFIDGAGRISLTLKGYQYYKLVCKRYGLEFNVRELTDDNGLYQLAEKVSTIRLHNVHEQIQADYLAGIVPLVDRVWVEAHLKGDFKGYLSATRARGALEDCGPSVALLS